ncbi:MAG: hypothetical protein ABID04_00450 [Patescibacteria group bacterium]
MKWYMWLLIGFAGLALLGGALFGGCAIGQSTTPKVIEQAVKETVVVEKEVTRVVTQATSTPEPSGTPTTQTIKEDVQAHGPTPQPQERHFSSYVETGVGNSRTWKFDVGTNEVLILGGWAVDGKDGGVYRAIAGPQKVETTVADGFALVIKREWAQAEWEDRLAQANANGWAAGTIVPLATW